jgi:hypothetical protein
MKNLKALFWTLICLYTPFIWPFFIKHEQLDSHCHDQLLKYFYLSPGFTPTFLLSTYLGDDLYYPLLFGLPGLFIFLLFLQIRKGRKPAVISGLAALVVMILFSTVLDAILHK